MQSAERSARPVCRACSLKARLPRSFAPAHFFYLPSSCEAQADVLRCGREAVHNEHGTSKKRHVRARRAEKGLRR